MFQVPGLHTTLIRSREDWQFRLEKDRRCCKASLDGACLLSRGRVLGGTSTIDNLLYTRGNYEDYDRNNFEFWNGNMSYEIFHHLEGFKGNNCSSCKYGKVGLLHLETVNYTDSAKIILMDAYKESGYKRKPRRATVGFGEKLLLLKGGERFNVAKAFLSPIKYRENLLLAKNSVVEGITVTERIDKRANGVNVSIDGVTFNLRAKKEVILAAGAINNAKLLLLSGVGSRGYLTSQKLPTYIDIPAVGKNLMFHLTLPVFVAIASEGHNGQNYYSEMDLIKDTADYVLKREGNFSHTNIQDFVNYINPVENNSGYPTLAIYHMYFKIGDRNLMAWVDAMNYHPKIINSLLQYNRDKGLVLFLITLLYPRSRGEVLLNDTHHLSNPKIKGNFLTDEEQYDFKTLLGGFVYVNNLTDHMQKRNAEFVDLKLPECKNFKFCSQAYVKCYILSMAFPNHDVAGTTKMGPECDESAVVKETLEVRQMRCLRVADSSVLNTIPLGGTVATDVMIGFRLGEILKEKWLKDYISPFHKVV